MTTATLPACRCSHPRAAHDDPALRPQCTARGCMCLRYWPVVERHASTNVDPAARPATKTCTGCGATKPIDEFYLRYADGRSTERIPKCRDCNNTRARIATPGRRGRAAELNAGYFLDGVKYCQAQERARSMPSLFDLDEAVPA